MWSELTWFMWSDFILFWSDVNCSDVEWTDVIYVKWLCFGFKWTEVSFGEVLGDKSTVHIRVTLYWGCLIVLWLFHLVYILYCGCFNLFCNGWVCICVGFVMCRCFGNMCTCIYCVCTVFALYRLCIFILICFVCTVVKTTATGWKLNCRSSNNDNNNDNNNNTLLRHQMCD
jgi:hypothetical protein